jgi:uncharacterized membrane protein
MMPLGSGNWVVMSVFIFIVLVALAFMFYLQPISVIADRINKRLARLKQSSARSTHKKK